MRAYAKGLSLLTRFSFLKQELRAARSTNGLEINLERVLDFLNIQWPGALSINMYQRYMNLFFIIYKSPIMKNNICKSCPASQRLQLTQLFHAFKATDHRSSAWLYLWRMALGSSVPDTPEAFVQSVRRQTGHVVFQQQSFIECIARFEVKKKTLLFTLENFSFERCCTYWLSLLFCWFHTFHTFFLGVPQSCLPLKSQPMATPFEAVLTLLSARPTAAAPSVAHGLRPLVVAFFGGVEKHWEKVELCRTFWEISGVWNYLM